jgi:hypothetical protein
MLPNKLGTVCTYFGPKLTPMFSIRATKNHIQCWRRLGSGTPNIGLEITTRKRESQQAQKFDY